MLLRAVPARNRGCRAWPWKHFFLRVQKPWLSLKKSGTGNDNRIFSLALQDKSRKECDDTPGTDHDVGVGVRGLPMEAAGRSIAGRSARLSESRTENPPVPFLCFSGAVFGCRNGIEKTGKQGKQGTTVRICKQCGRARVRKTGKRGIVPVKTKTMRFASSLVGAASPIPL